MSEVTLEMIGGEIVRILAEQAAIRTEMGVGTEMESLRADLRAALTDRSDLRLQVARLTEILHRVDSSVQLYD